MVARRILERWSCCARLGKLAIGHNKEIKTMTMSSGGGGAMYGFLACTASQFMTPTVITLERQTTIGQLGALFEHTTSMRFR